VTRPRPVVIDASVALALILDEPESNVLGGVLKAWIVAGRAALVPSHFWLEVVSRLSRVPGADGASMLAAIHRLDGLGLSTIDLSRAMLVQAIDRVERFRLTAYDAMYLVLAEDLDADLATLDRMLSVAAGSRAVTFHDDHHLHEAPAVYEHDVTWPNYKHASAYLAKLRAEALADRT
jgi:predicted nucleic acid-binding protein